MDRSTLEAKSVDDLRELAKQLDMSGYARLRKAELIDAILDESENRDEEPSQDGGDGDDDAGGRKGDSDRSEVIKRRSRTRNRNDDDDASDNGRSRARSRDRRKGRSSDLDGLEEREGVLDLLPEGYGFLRTTGYVSGERDVYVSQSYVRRFNLRRGDLLGGPVRFNKGNDKFPALARLETCEGEVVDNEHDPVLHERRSFDELEAVFPDDQLLLGEDGPALLSAIDLLAPIGLGQRALLLAPPTADTGSLVQALTEAVAQDAPDAERFVALIDARPEDISACRRGLDADVVGSPLDAPPEDHVAAAELVVERARRLAERGRDVVVVLDSLSQLGRAYNLAGSSSGRTLPGGIDTGAIAPLKQLFGVARNLDGEGSVTMLAVIGADPESATDRTILEHLRGAANCELRLDPVAGADGGLPALDLTRSGTRRAEALVGSDLAADAEQVRRALGEVRPAVAWRTIASALPDAPVATLVQAAQEASA